MSGPTITLQGLADAQKQLARIERGARAMGNYRTTVGSYVPYAYGVEFGQHRVNGRAARRAGGAEYLTRAVADVTSGADEDLSAGLTKVSAPGKWVLRRLARWARRLARLNVPVQSGRLRRSIRIDVWREG
jgi:hypothetical protein